MNHSSVNRAMVSTIIPVFNRPTMLHRAVESVLCQDYSPIEIIIVNDGSTDNTLSVAKALQDEHQEIKVITIANSGPGSAREAGRLAASGEFIQYLDSDDILLPKKFSKQVEQLNLNPECGVCYCQTSLQRLDGTTLTSWKRTGETIKTIIPAMLASRWWDTSTPLYRRSVTDAVGPWSDLINEEDWEYDCRVGFQNKRLAYVPEVLSVQIQHNLPRLSQNGATDLAKLKSRAAARKTIIELAINRDETNNSDELITQLKYSLLLARQCGAAGLTNESRRLFQLAAHHLRRKKINLIELTIYEYGAFLLGWSIMGRLSEWLDKLRS